MRSTQSTGCDGVQLNSAFSCKNCATFKIVSFGAAVAEFRSARLDNWSGPERQILDVVRWYEARDHTLARGFNTAALREATLEYNQVKAGLKKVGKIVSPSRMEALIARICQPSGTATGTYRPNRPT